MPLSAATALPLTGAAARVAAERDRATGIPGGFLAQMALPPLLLCCLLLSLDPPCHSPPAHPTPANLGNLLGPSRGSRGALMALAPRPPSPPRQAAADEARQVELMGARREAFDLGRRAGFEKGLAVGRAHGQFHVLRASSPSS